MTKLDHLQALDMSFTRKHLGVWEMSGSGRRLEQPVVGKTVSEIVERMARAICSANGIDLGFSGFGDEGWEDFIPEARSVIETVRSYLMEEFNKHPMSDSEDVHALRTVADLLGKVK